MDDLGVPLFLETSIHPYHFLGTSSSPLAGTSSRSDGCQCHGGHGGSGSASMETQLFKSEGVSHAAEVRRQRFFFGAKKKDEYIYIYTHNYFRYLYIYIYAFFQTIDCFRWGDKHDILEFTMRLRMLVFSYSYVVDLIDFEGRPHSSFQSESRRMLQKPNHLLNNIPRRQANTKYWSFRKWFLTTFKSFSNHVQIIFYAHVYACI